MNRHALVSRAPRRRPASRSSVRADAGSNVRHGPYRVSYPSGELKDSGVFRDDARDGRWTKWSSIEAQTGLVRRH